MPAMPARAVDQPAPIEPQSGGSTLRRVGSTLVRLCLVVAIVGLTVRLLADLDWAELARRLRSASGGWLVLTLLALIVRYPIWDQRWRRALDVLGIEVSRRLSMGALVASVALNSVTPSARVFGGLLRARYLSRLEPQRSAEGRSFGRTYGSVLYDQLQHQVVVGALSLVAVVLAGGSLGAGGAALGVLLVLLILMAWGWWRMGRGDGSLWLQRAGQRLARRALERPPRSARWARLLEHSGEALETVARLLTDRTLAAWGLGLGVAFFAVNAAAQWLSFRAIDAEVAVIAVVAVVALGAFAGLIAGTPGGIGAAEAAMIAAYVALGVERVDAAAGTLLFRGLHYLVTFSSGLPSLALLELAVRRRARAER